jgi:glutathione S-transferase
MTTVRLFSAKACPFAHRTRLVLAEKGVEFELTEIDLSNKPRDFAAVSAYGNVPAEYYIERYARFARQAA